MQSSRTAPADQIPTRSLTLGLVSYEKRLDRDRTWALMEGSKHFEGKSAVFDALRKITSRLNTFDVPYAVAGGMALFQHGFRRFTEDVDILVRKEDLKSIHDRLVGLGYLPPFSKSKNLRDTELGVKIDFLLSGEFPGDGKPKPVAFPDPSQAAVEFDGVRYLNLDTLIELKLASGMTGAGRLKDLVDVSELIAALDLPLDLAAQLKPYVQGKYRELWMEARRRYVTYWRNKWLTANAKSIDEMIASLRAAADELENMKADGVTLDPEGGTADDYAVLVTTTKAVADKYGMEDETEYWDDEELEGESEVRNEPKQTHPPNPDSSS